MGSDLMELNKIWDTFFFPVLDSVIAYAFFLALFGRKAIIRFREHLFPKKDGKYCRKVYQLSAEGKLISSYAPISEDFMDLLHKPVPLIIICLIGCLAFYRILTPFSLLYPIYVSYEPTSIVPSLDQIDDETFATIWSQYPNLDFWELMEKVMLNRLSNDDYSYLGEFVTNIDLVIKFCASISFIRLAFCAVCFLVIVFAITINFSLYLMFSLPLIFKFVTNYAPIKLRTISFPHSLKTAYSFLMRTRADLLKISNKALFSCLKKLLSAIRALLLCAVFILLSFISGFQIIHASKAETALAFHLEKIVESEKYIISDEILNDYLQKVQETRNEQPDMRFHLVVHVGFPGYSRVIANFNDFPPMMREFILNFEYG